MYVGHGACVLGGGGVLRSELWLQWRHPPPHPKPHIPDCSTAAASTNKSMSLLKLFTAPLVLLFLFDPTLALLGSPCDPSVQLAGEPPPAMQSSVWQKFSSFGGNRQIFRPEVMARLHGFDGPAP